MKILRSGIEDFDLFTLAGQIVGQEVLTEKILSVVPSLTEVRGSGDKLLEIRKEIGDLIEKGT